MAIGITHSSLSVKDILDKGISEADIASHYLSITNIPCIVNSPLRIECNPSFSITFHKGKIRWKDFASNQTGGLWDLLMLMWKCSFASALHKVYSDIITDTHVSVNIRKKITVNSNTDNIVVECKIRDWEKHDIEYWKSYGIDQNWLKYAEVYPISHKIITKNNRRFVFGAEKYAYSFVEHKEGVTTMKIYQPYSKKHKWSNGHNGSVVSLWNKIPYTGDNLVICSSLKDALCVSCQLHIPAIAIQGEGFDMSDSAIKSLKERYKRIFVSLDTDDVGKKNTVRLVERTGFIPAIPDLGSCKDFSDYYKSLVKKEDFQKLRSLFV